jgi:phosphoadenosine phosphosulfate reductase
MPDDSRSSEFVEGFAGLEGRELIKAVVTAFGKRVALVSSFGAESAVLLHMVSEVARDLPVIFLDAGKLFPETLAYRDQLIAELGLTNVRTIHPQSGDLAAADPDGLLHRVDTDGCCHIRKTLPLERALTGFDVVISGRKRFHGALRSNLEFVGFEGGRLKIEPLASFTALDLQTYMLRHHLPSHPLKLAGYRSIGCVPCTTPGGTDEDPRAGRWAGADKTECGIHFTANGQIIRTVTRQSAAALT